MARKATGGAGGGAHLASGYISLNVKYGSAMAQIADDFGLMNKRAKETGESITRNLVAGVDAAKAKAAALSAEYEANRQKVAALRVEVEKLHASQVNSSQAEKAYNEANTREVRRKIQHQQQAVDLQLELNRLNSQSGKYDVSGLTAWNAKHVAFTNARKAELKELSDAEKAYQQNRMGPEASKAEEAARKSLDAELAKGAVEYKKLGEALQDVTRKQELAKTSAAGLQGVHQSFGSRFVSMMKQTGTQAGQQFRATFGSQMSQAKTESAHHARNIASGIFMGMTPGVIGAAGVGLALGKAFGAGFNREETMNVTRMRLEALGMTATNVQALMDQARGSVEGTQYSLAESFTASSTAMQAGVKLGPEMVQYLNNIANAAGLTGVAYGEVAESIGRVQRLGYVSLENIDPLIKKDLPVLKWLKEYYAKDFPATTQQDIAEMISKKMIPADVLQKVLTANLNDSMKLLGRNTVKGALTDAMTQVGKVTQSILHPFMGDWPAFINNVGDKLKRFADYIKPGMEVAAAWIKKTWNDLWPKVTAVISKAVTFMVGLWDRFGPKLMAAWNYLWPRIIGIAKGFFDWFHTVWIGLSPIVKKFIDKFSETWTKMWPQLQEKFGPFVAAFKRLWPEIQPLIKLIAGLFAWMANEFIKHLPAFAQFGTNIVNWIATALNWMRTEAWPWMKEAWKNLKEWVATATETVGRWKDNVIDTFNSIKSKTEGVWTWLKEKFDWLGGLSMPEWAKWLIEHGASAIGIDLAASSTALVPGAGDSVPKPARLTDRGHVPSGPQSKYVAGLVLDNFDIQGDIGGSYLPKSEGGPSVPGTHDAGLSIDIPIGTSADQRAEGDRIEKFLQANAKQLGIVYTIWKDVGRQTGVNPNRPAGSTFAAEPNSHQNHIDVMFDGKTFGKAVASVGSNGQVYTVAPMVSSTPTNPLWDKIAERESNNDWDNNNTGGHMTSSGAPRGGLQITDGTWKAYGGEEFAPHANEASKADQITVAKRIAFQGYQGSGPQGLSAWEVINQGKVAGVTPTMTAADFGGISNLSITKPLAPNVVVPQPPSPPVLPAAPWDLPIQQTPHNPNDVSIAGPMIPTMPNVNRQGYEPPLIDLKMLPWQGNPGIVGDTLTNFNPGPMRPSVGMAPWALGVQDPRDYMPGSTSTRFNYNGRDAYRKGREGPKGTKDDPITTTDPQVGKNTDPKNQPKPDEPQPVAPSTPATPSAETPHGTTAGAAPGPGGPSVKPGDGSAYKDLATGLGGVASTAFSDQFAGTPFSDPSKWPGTKSLGAVFTFFGNLLSGGGGQAGGGLAGMLFPGSARGETPATARQLREAAKDINRKIDDVKAQQAKVNDMVGKPQFGPEGSPERMEEIDKLRDMTEDLGDMQTDYAAKQGGAAPFDPLANLKSAWGIPSDTTAATPAVADIMAPVPVPGRAPAGPTVGPATGPLPGPAGAAAQGAEVWGGLPGVAYQRDAAGKMVPVPPVKSAAGQGFPIPFPNNLPGYTPGAYGQVGIGSPGVAPGSMGADTIVPGAAATIPAVMNAAMPQQNAQPTQPGGNAQNNIDMSITQQVATPGITEASNAAKRAQNTQMNSPLLNLTRGVLV